MPSRKPPRRAVRPSKPSPKPPKKAAAKAKTAKKPAKKPDAKPAKKPVRMSSPKTAKRAPVREAANIPAARRAPPAPPSVPSGIGLINHHIDFTSHDLAGVRRFYTELMGFTQFEHDPQMNYLMVQTGSSSSLGFMPPMPGPPEEWRPPREPALYFMVADVDRAHADLAARGVLIDQAPQDMPWGHRVTTLRDPEGRRVCLAQVKPK